MSKYNIFRFIFSPNLLNEHLETASKYNFSIRDAFRGRGRGNPRIKFRGRGKLVPRNPRGNPGKKWQFPRFPRPRNPRSIQFFGDYSGKP